MAANWKMNLSLDEARDLLNGIKSATIDFNRVDVLVAPPFTTLQLAQNNSDRDRYSYCRGRIMHWGVKGGLYR